MFTPFSYTAYILALEYKAYYSNLQGNLEPTEHFVVEVQPQAPGTGKMSYP